MTRDEIIRMAREAGFPFTKYGTLECDEDGEIDADEMFERFAALVAAAEREAAIEEAPPPPKLSDDRIREIWIEHGLDDEDVEGFARAIEREILGGGHE